MFELLSNSQMANADDLTIKSGTPGLQLMENAGRAIARCVLEAYPGSHQMRVLCGPGNNGGDGFVVARLLKNEGWNVTVALLGNQDNLQGDAAEMARAWNGPIEPLLEDGVLDGADLIIDAIFGAGLARPITGDLAAFIEKVNTLGVPIISVDIPTGIDGSDGSIKGTAVKADHTVTFFRRKPGHLLLPGREHCGTVHLADIGIKDDVLNELSINVFANEPEIWRDEFPGPSACDHKYDKGHALIMSGDEWSTGAARLAARAALRVGAGLVTLASPTKALPVNAAHLTAIMMIPCDGPDDLSNILSDERKKAFLIGPAAGISDRTRKNVIAALKTQASLVLDADALSVFENNPSELFVAIKTRQAATVLTPHEGEFRRLFPDIAQISSKLQRAQEAAAESGAIIVLKGADTIIADPNGTAVINENAPPFLATAGSGDVLAGIITGLLAQSMPAHAASCAGVWLHGEAAAMFGRGLIAEDLPELLPALLDNLPVS